jgi:uncharacterized BrkB/YihY/UPF0761 family membrane protein
MGLSGCALLDCGFRRFQSAAVAYLSFQISNRHHLRDPHRISVRCHSRCSLLCVFSVIPFLLVFAVGVFVRSVTRMLILASGSAFWSCLDLPVGFRVFFKFLILRLFLAPDGG